MSGVGPNVENVENRMRRAPMRRALLENRPPPPIANREGEPNMGFRDRILGRLELVSEVDNSPTVVTRMPMDITMVEPLSYWPARGPTGPTVGDDAWEAAVRQAAQSSATGEFCAKCGIEDADGRRWRTRQGQITWLCSHQAEMVQFG